MGEKMALNKKNIRIAISPCPNDIFIFSGLLLRKIKLESFQFEFSFLDIQTLNQEFLKNSFDFIKVSAIQLNKNKNYQMLRNGGAMGYGCGPLLLSQIHTQIKKELPVLLPGRETTAHALFNFYNQNKDIQKEFLSFDRVYQKLKTQKNSQGVIIHESRFTYQEDFLNCISDLGEYWERQTGLPIPLGILMLKKCYDKILFEQAIQQSIEWAENHFEESLNLCLKYSQEISKEVCLSHIKLYVNTFSKNVGTQGMEALDFLLKN